MRILEDKHNFSLPQWISFPGTNDRNGNHSRPTPLSHVDTREMESFTRIISATPASIQENKEWYSDGIREKEGKVNTIIIIIIVFMQPQIDKMWSTGEKNGKPLQHSCPENLINGMKRQKDMTLKSELPRSVDAQYATGEDWKNSSRRNEVVVVQLLSCAQCFEPHGL